VPRAYTSIYIHRPASTHAYISFITSVYLQSVQNTISKWEETETNGEEESSHAYIGRNAYLGTYVHIVTDVNVMINVGGAVD
jgi:hypothetical protein